MDNVNHPSHMKEAVDRRCSIKQVFLKNRKFLRKTHVLESLFNKVAGLKEALLKKDLNTGLFL